MQEVVEELTRLGRKIATMESCTGGALVNEITNIEGASNVLEFSAVTYSNSFKIKLGVNEETINNYGVYSREVAREMAYNISKYASSSIGIGVTGKMNRKDIYNNTGNDDEIFACIYCHPNEYYEIKIKASKNTRLENKQMVVNIVTSKLQEILKIDR